MFSSRECRAACRNNDVSMLLKNSREYESLLGSFSRINAKLSRNNVKISRLNAICINFLQCSVMTCQTPSRRYRIQTWFNGYRQSCSVLS